MNSFTYDTPNIVLNSPSILIGYPIIGANILITMNSVVHTECSKNFDLNDKVNSFISNFLSNFSRANI